MRRRHSRDVLVCCSIVGGLIWGRTYSGGRGCSECLDGHACGVSMKHH